MLCQRTDIHAGISEAGLASASNQLSICELHYLILKISLRSSRNGQGRDVDRLGREGE
jgi:hypothetical protein